MGNVGKCHGFCSSDFDISDARISSNKLDHDRTTKVLLSKIMLLINYLILSEIRNSPSRQAGKRSVVFKQ